MVVSYLATGIVVEIELLYEAIQDHSAEMCSIFHLNQVKGIKRMKDF